MPDESQVIDPKHVGKVKTTIPASLSLSGAWRLRAFFVYSRDLDTYSFTSLWALKSKIEAV